MANGAAAERLAARMVINLLTLQRWQSQFAGAADGVDSHKCNVRYMAHRLSEEARRQILAVFNQPRYPSLPQCHLKAPFQVS